MDPTSKPEPTPEGRLLGDAREAAKLSFRAASALAGISEAWWRNIESGYQSMGNGWFKPVDNATPETLASMAKAVGVSPDALRGAGRADAAEELERVMTRDTAAINKDGPSTSAKAAEALEALPEGLRLAFLAAIRSVHEELARRADDSGDSEYKKAI
jgi:transcriptional regulator with XRE-family HTH domain